MNGKEKKGQTRPLGEVVDLFCGVGGLSHGLKRAGFEIKAGYDTDARCKFAFETNNGGIFHRRDIAKLGAEEIKCHFSGNLPSVLAGCAPCQPFSTYKQGYGEDPQWGLVELFAKLAAKSRADFVTMENVPALVRYKEGHLFRRFLSILKDAGYSVEWTIAKCEEFGVAQLRRRLVLLAAKGKPSVALRSGRTASVTVKEAIGHLAPLAAGATDPDDRLHVACALSSLNLKRIRASRPGGTWRDWPQELRAACHKKASGKTYASVYARMRWEEPSPTMTTQCYGFGNGRFGHPEQDRAISLREAAIFQSFPAAYQFLPAGEKIALQEVGRWIGNAVPVKLGEAIGRHIIQLY